MFISVYQHQQELIFKYFILCISQRASSLHYLYLELMAKTNGGLLRLITPKVVLFLLFQMSSGFVESTPTTANSRQDEKL